MKTKTKVTLSNLHNKVIKRMKNNSLSLITAELLPKYMRELKLPVYYEKEVIVNYPQNELRNRGYSTGLMKMALTHDCIIVFKTMSQREHFRESLEYYAVYNDKPKTTFWQRLLIKLNL